MNGRFLILNYCQTNQQIFSLSKFFIAFVFLFWTNHFHYWEYVDSVILHWLWIITYDWFINFLNHRLWLTKLMNSRDATSEMDGHGQDSGRVKVYNYGLGVRHHFHHWIKIERFPKSRRFPLSHLKFSTFSIFGYPENA